MGEMINEIKISIVIILRNEAKRIEKCLKSILMQKEIESQEIIVIDGASDDDTKDIVKYYMRRYKNIKLIECTEWGYGYQRNLGANEAIGEYLLYISGDAVMTKNLLAKYLNNMQMYDIVQGTILNVGQEDIFSKVMKELLKELYKKKTNLSFEEFSTVNVCIKRKLILDYPFSELYKAFEDKAWMLEHGSEMNFKWLHSALVYHTIHESFMQYVKKVVKEAKVLGEIWRHHNKRKNSARFDCFNWINMTRKQLCTIGVLTICSLLFVLANSTVWVLLLALIPIVYRGYLAVHMIGKFKMKEKVLSFGMAYILLAQIQFAVLRGYISGSSSEVD